jgi:hypothetical protein
MNIILLYRKLYRSTNFCVEVLKERKNSIKEGKNLDRKE